MSIDIAEDVIARAVAHQEEWRKKNTRGECPPYWICFADWRALATSAWRSSMSVSNSVGDTKLRVVETQSDADEQNAREAIVTAARELIGNYGPYVADNGQLFTISMYSARPWNSLVEAVRAHKRLEGGGEHGAD